MEEATLLLAEEVGAGCFVSEEDVRDLGGRARRTEEFWWIDLGLGFLSIGWYGGDISRGSRGPGTGWGWVSNDDVRLLGFEVFEPPLDLSEDVGSGRDGCGFARL